MIEVWSQTCEQVELVPDPVAMPQDLRPQQATLRNASSTLWEFDSLDSGVARDPAPGNSDLTELASKFASHAGGGLPPELSADLALDIVLNEIAEQACLATRATGAAIVLERDGEMTCRASSGFTVPPLGTRLDIGAGLSGACIQSGGLLRCDDARSDPRADAEASQELGICSVLILPLVWDRRLVGLFELFSGSPAAFTERDERTLEALGARVIQNLERAARRIVVPEEPLAPPETLPAPHGPLADFSTFFEEPLERVVARTRRDLVTWGLGMAVVASALVLGVLVGRRFLWKAPVEQVVAAKQRATPDPIAERETINTPLSSESVPNNRSGAEPAKGATPRIDSTGIGSNRRDRAGLPEGGLQVFENGKEVFRMPPDRAANPPASQPQGTVREAAIVQPEPVLALPPDEAETSVSQRVEPDYPEQARLEGIQGAVVLDVRIAQDGTVQEIKVISGPPALVEPSMDAVRRWKFQPRRVNGNLVEMQTQVTLNFRLPEQ